MSMNAPAAVPAAAIRRCLSVIADWQREVADQVVPVDGGTAVLTPSLPLVWDANLLRLLARAGVSASDLVATAGRLTVEHRVARVMVTTDDLTRARLLAPAFAALGWAHEEHLLMLATGLADRAPHRWAPVAEVGATPVVGLRREWLESQSWATPGIVEQVLQHDGRLARRLGERCFAVQINREVASCCRLYQRADVAQIENVVTAPLQRNKGYARAVIAAARTAAEAAGARDVFLVTAAGAWPRDYYERLGFSPAQLMHRFRQDAP